MRFTTALLLLIAIQLSLSQANECTKSKHCKDDNLYCAKCFKAKKGHSIAPFSCETRSKIGEKCNNKYVTDSCKAKIRCERGLRCRSKKCKCKSKSTNPACNSPSPPPPGPGPNPSNCKVGEVPINGACKKYKWSFGPSLPVKHGEGTVAIHQDKMYMVGDGVYNQPSNTNGYTLMLDLKGSSNKNNWDWENPNNGNARDQRDYHGDHSAGEFYNGKWYVFSGLCCQSYCHGSNTIGSCQAYNKVQIYNPSTDKWSLGANIPWFVDGGMSSATINGLMYVCGGMEVKAAKSLDKCGIYNPNTNTWNLNIPDMPQDVHHTASGSDGSKFYVFGGREGGNGLSDGKGYVQIYNPATNSWTWDNSLPNPRTGLGRAAYLGGEFYVMGGETFVDALKTVDIYNPASGTWRSGPPMLQELHGIYPVVYKDRILVPGGCPNTDRGVSNYFLVYEPE
eukprot:m.119454 g.119454  ORF g.119454 m.119454 type:complete len:450 (+) comp15592_c0_seq1:84-1433(+)